MEGDGKGLLMLLQGLSEDGTMVTLVKRQRDPQSRRQLFKSRSSAKSLVHRSSVQTSTETHARGVNTSSQISDDRYTSCYRVAHCSVNPSSPPVSLSEFPPQRNSPTFKDGNFQVGGPEHCDLREQRLKYHNFRRKPWPDSRGSVHCSRSTRDMEAFTNSLRKYPRPTLNRTVSSELLEKLLDHVQAKYSQNPPRTQSSRSLHKRKSREHPARTHRQVQTYTRTRDITTHASDVTTEGVNDVRDGVDAADDGRRSRRDGNYRLKSPVSDGGNIDQNNTSYNYLKTTRSRSPRPDREFRHNELNRHVRRAVRQVFQVCPKMQGRYNEHKKICPARTSAWFSDDDEQASTSRLCRLLASLSGCGVPTNKGPSTGQAQCRCTKSTQCKCNKICKCCPIKNKSSEPIDCTCEPCLDSCREICECKPESDAEYYSNKIHDIVTKWLNTIPIVTNETPQDKIKRELMVEDLAEKLKHLPEDENFLDRAKEVIERCLENLPMWSPENKQAKMQFRQQLATNLLEIISEVSRKPDRMRDIVKTIVEDLNFDGDVDKKEITDNLINKLKLLAIHAPEDPEEYKALLISEIVPLLEELPIEFTGDIRAEVHKIADKLAENVMKLNDIDIVGLESFRDTFKKYIADIIDQADQLADSSLSKKEKYDMINNLADKLEMLQTHGHDEMVCEKIKNDVHKILQRFSITSEMNGEFTENLLDTVTDTIFRKNKENLEATIKQETLKEIRHFLQDIPGVEELSEIEQFNLVNEIRNTIHKAQSQGRQDYQGDVIENLKNFGIKNPELAYKHVETLVNQMLILPSKIKEIKLKENLRKHFRDVIDDALIPEDKKADLKDKLNTIISEKIQASSLGSKRDIYDTKEVLLEQMDNIIKGLNITDKVKNELKDKLDNSIERTFDDMISTRDKVATKHVLKKEINYVLDSESIPEEEKNDLKYKFKKIFDEYLDQPYSIHVKANIHDMINNVVGDSSIDRDKKENLINKLMSLADEYLKDLPTETIKQHIKNKTLREILNAIENYKIPQNVKNDLKNSMTNMFNEMMCQPYSEEVKDDILERINDIILDSAIPSSSLKDKLLSKLNNVINDNLNQLPYQIQADFAKENIMSYANELIDDLSIPKGQVDYIKNNLGLILADALDRPYVSDQRDKIKRKVSDIIAQSHMPSEEKEDFKNKLMDIVNKELESVPIQTPAEFAKESILRELRQIIDTLVIPSDEKNDLKNKLEDIVEERLREGYLGDMKDLMKKDIQNILFDSPIPWYDQDVLINKMANVANNILDEAFYDDNVREHLLDIYDTIDRAPITKDNKEVLKCKVHKIIDDHSKDPEFIEIKEIIKQGIALVEVPADELLGLDELDTGINEKTVEDIVSAIEKAPILANKGTTIVRSLKDKLLNHLNKPKEFKKILDRTVEELPLSMNDKKALKSKLFVIVLEADVLETQLRNTLIKDIETAIDSESIGKDKKTELKSKLNDIITNFEDSICTYTKDKIKADMFKVLDEVVVSKDKKNHLKSAISNLTDKLQTQVQDVKIIKNKILARAGDAIDKVPIRLHIKKNLKSLLRGIVSEYLKPPFQANMSNKMKDDIAEVLCEAPITQYQRDDLKKNILDIVSKELEQLPVFVGSKNAIDLVLTDINRIIDEEPLTKVQKSTLKDKLKKIYAEESQGAAAGLNRKKIIKSIIESIDDAVIPKDNKNNLKVKLENAVNKTLQAAQSPTKARDSMSLSLAQNVCDAVEDLPIPEDKKIYLKKKLKDTLFNSLNRPISGDLGITVTSDIADVIDEIALSVTQKSMLKNKLTDIVYKKIDEMESEMEKEAIRNTILDEMQQVLDDAQLPKEKKKELLNKLTNMLDENLRSSLNSNTMQLVKDAISNITDEFSISRDKKLELGRRLTTIMDDIELPDKRRQSRKSRIPSNIRSEQFYEKQKSRTDGDEDFLQDRVSMGGSLMKVNDNIFYEVDSVLESLQITQNEKKDLRKQLRSALGQSLESPVSMESVKTLKKDVSHILNQSGIAQDKKVKASNLIKKILDKNVEPQRKGNIRISTLQDKELGTVALKSLLNEILEEVDTVLSNIPENERNQLKVKLSSSINKYLDKSQSLDILKVIQEEVNSIISDASIPGNKKADLKRKITVLINNTEDNIVSGDQKVKLESVSFNYKPVGLIKLKLFEVIDSVVDQAEITNAQKEDLRSKLKDTVEDSLGNRVNSDTIQVIKDNMNNIISEAAIPSNKKQNLQNEFTNMVDINVRPRQSDNMSRMAAKRKSVFYDSRLAVSSSTSKQAPMLGVKETVLSRIDSVLNKFQLTTAEKKEMKSKIKDVIVDVLDRPLSMATLEVVKADINNIIAEAPIPRERKSMIRNEISSLINKHTESWTEEDDIENLKKPKTAAMRLGPDESGPTPSSTQGSLSRIIFDSDIKDDEISVSIPLPNVKQAISKGFGDVLNDLDIPIDKKHQVVAKLEEIVDEYENELLVKRGVNVFSTKQALMRDVSRIINELNLPSKLKCSLKEQLADVVIKEMDTMQTTDQEPDDSRGIFAGTIHESILKGIKERKRSSAPAAPVSHGRRMTRIFQDHSIPEEEGPITSTPKKDRIDFTTAGTSAITVEEFDLSLSQDEKDCWQQLERVICDWIDELPFNLDSRARDSVKAGIASDIKDRQRYLKLNPGAKKTFQEELENLQYQLFRRLDKELDAKDMSTLVETADVLMRSMQEVQASESMQAETSTASHRHVQIGPTYKQLLEDTITKVLPEHEDATFEERVSLEIMKDEIADAFINLHYTGGNEEEREKLKNKIKTIVDKYCDDYLKKGRSLDSENTHRDLYTELKKLPKPDDDSMKSEVEHARVKDLVGEWMKEVPMREQSATERLETKVKANTLAKNIMTIEQNDEQHSDTEIKRHMENEVTQFLDDIPFVSGYARHRDSLTKKIIENLRKTRDTRKFDETTRYSVQFDNGTASKSLQVEETSAKRPDRSTTYEFPPCSLTPEDREHLERIRKRACLAPDCLSSLLRSDKRNAAASPMPVEAGSQTELNFDYLGKPSVPPVLSPPRFVPRTCPGMPPASMKQPSPLRITRYPCMEDGSSHFDIQPQVIIKEYYWDSVDEEEIAPEPRLTTGGPKHPHFNSPPRVPCEIPEPCPAARPSYSTRCAQQKSFPTCTDAQSPRITSPCSSRVPYNPRVTRIPSPQHIPVDQPNQESHGSILKDEHNVPKSDGQKPSEVSGRRERVIDLGDLDNVRIPCHKIRTPEDFGWCPRFADDDFWEPACSGHGFVEDREMPYIRDRKEENPRCKCRERLVSSCAQRRARSQCTGRYTGWRPHTAAAGNARRCSKCYEVSCPYPSYYYFTP